MTDDNLQISPDDPKPQRKRRGYCACGLLLLVIAVAGAIWLMRSSSVSRFRVVGPTDPLSGCRIEYSVSSHYTSGSVPNPEGFVGNADYLPKPPQKWIAWVDAHLMHKSQAKSPMYLASEGQIEVIGRQLNAKQTKSSDDFHSPTYYPVKTAQSTMPTLEFKHLEVSGAAVTWYVTQFQGRGPGKHMFRSFTLFVHPLHVPISYTFHGFTEGEEDQAKLRAEMLAISDSIRIVKVKQAKP
jgi:hypothetical protein